MNIKGAYIDWSGWKKAGHPLPGETAHLALMPFGRTSASTARSTGQAGVDFREAAVFIGIDRKGSIAMIRRTLDGGVHGGQMALPGGQRERGETLIECAVREWREELGIPDSCGPLSPPVALTEVHVAPSGFIVRPHVAPVDLPSKVDPDPLEVAEVHHVALADLIRPEHRAQQKVRAGGDAAFTILAPGFDLPETPFIWGATAMILAEVAEWAARWGRDLSD